MYTIWILLIRNLQEQFLVGNNLYYYNSESFIENEKILYQFYDIVYFTGRWHL